MKQKWELRWVDAWAEGENSWYDNETRHVAFFDVVEGEDVVGKMLAWFCEHDYDIFENIRSGVYEIRDDYATNDFEVRVVENGMPFYRMTLIEG